MMRELSFERKNGKLVLSKPVDEVFTPHGAKSAKDGKRAALYMRVSTEEQTTTNQRPELARMAKQRGLTIVREYVETQSAAKVRPVFDRMMKEARAGDFDVLFIWALDRFGRSMVGNLELVVKLDGFGTRIVSAREDWLDTSSPARMLLVGIFSWVAEQERNRLSERTRAGMDRARAQGKAIGRPRAHVPMHIARKMRREGASYEEIGRHFGTSTMSVGRAFARELLDEVTKGGPSARGAKVAKSRSSRTPNKNGPF
jgi:DNA invertase Pin-like site-specific DNA recombinase